MLINRDLKDHNYGSRMNSWYHRDDEDDGVDDNDQDNSQENYDNFNKLSVKLLTD